MPAAPDTRRRPRGLDDVGGQQYLAEQAAKNPTAFMTLLGRVLPLTLAGDASEPAISVQIVRYGVDTGVRRGGE